MATLAVLRDQIIRRLSGGDPSSDSQLDEREIELHILQALNAAIKIEYYNNIRAEDIHGVSGQFIYTFTADVKKDALRGEQYIEMVTPHVALPNDKGIHEITPVNGKCKTFIPVRNGSVSLYRGLPAGNLEMGTGFYPERGKVFFTKDIMCQGVSKVRVKIIAAYGSDLVIDPAMEESVIKAVMGIMTPALPQDKIVDNVDDRA